MLETKVTAMSAPTEDDPDVFIRICNSRMQRLRQETHRRKDHRKRVALRLVRNLAVAAAGGAVTFGVLALMF